MDIRSNGKYPANKLSNFAIHHFTFDGVPCVSMEGFLQSLKFKNPNMQEQVCSLGGMAAKKKGSKKNWQKKQTLWWRGVPYKRDSEDYQNLLDRAYNALFNQNMGAYLALEATQNATLKHSIGGSKKSETVLTTQEFVSRLMRIRKDKHAKKYLEM